MIRAIEERTGDEAFDFASRLVIVRSTARRGVNVSQNFEDFGYLTLEMIFNFTNSQYLNHPRNWAVRITFEIKTTCSALPSSQNHGRIEKRR